MKNEKMKRKKGKKPPGTWNPHVFLFFFARSRYLAAFSNVRVIRHSRAISWIRSFVHWHQTQKTSELAALSPWQITKNFQSDEK